MTIQLHWFLPTYGDSRLIVGGGHGTPRGAAHSDRDASIDYLASIVRAAETFGFTGALIPTGAWCEDAFITAALLARETTSLAFLVAFRPGLVSPTLSAQIRHIRPPRARPHPAQRGGRRRVTRAARVRRPPRQGRPLSPLRRVPQRGPPVMGR